MAAFIFLYAFAVLFELYAFVFLTKREDLISLSLAKLKST